MNKITIGIDLGTTYSAMAYVDENGIAKIIPNSESKITTPSVIFFESKENIMVGESAKYEMELSPEDVVAFVKREMGKTKDEVRTEENYGEPKPYDFFGHRYTPEEISSQILKKLKKDAESYLKSKITDAVITVPAYFNDYERNATIKAGSLAGLNVLKVINEPTAAAIAYGISVSKNQNIFVFDLGGGTFDVTILKIENGEFSVVATDGDHKLGGKDWDDKLIDFVADEFIAEYGEDPRDDSDSMADLRIKSENVKKSLSERESVVISIKYNGNKSETKISTTQFREICAPLLSRIEGLCDTVLSDAGLSWSNIDEVVMAGGSTRLKMIQELVSTISGKTIKTDLVNPDTCVALGAAIQGKILEDSNNNRLPAFKGRIKSVTDVTAHSLGFVTLKDNKLHNSKMISKNSKIPCKVSKQDFQTTRDNQENLEVLLLQGEASNPENCTLLEGYNFNLPKVKKGEKIEVTFQYNSNGVVEVSANTNNTNLSFTKIKKPILPDLAQTNNTPLSVVLAIDLSGSMSGRPLEEAKSAAKEFIRQMNFNYTQVALMPFADTVKVNQKFTKFQSDLERGINEWQIGMVGGANSAEPFAQSLEILKFGEGKKLIIVLTDGVWSYQNIAIENAQKCKFNEIEIRAIGFGSADINFLKQLSTSEDGYNFTRSGAELTQAMLNIATEITTNKIR